MRRALALALVAASLGCSTLGCSRMGLTLDLLNERHPNVLYSVETRERAVALTIDDGPDPVSTRRILDVLDENDARATFFLIADRIPGNEEVVAEIVASGHELGNHLTRDEPSVDLAPDEFVRELERSHRVLADYADTHWFRPGSGWHDDRMVEDVAENGYRMALGSEYPFDSHVPWSWFATRFLLWRTGPGDIVILHDVGERGERTAATLATVLPELRRRGFRVLSLSELVALSEPSAGGETP